MSEAVTRPPLLVFTRARLGATTLAWLAGVACFVAPRLHATYGRPFRAHGGDVALAAFATLLLGTFTSVALRWRAGAVLLVLFAIELSQLLGRPRHAGLAVELTVGATFDPLDLVAYVVGVAIAIWVERHRP